MPGGASAYRKGAMIERVVKRAYEATGCFVIRSPQSGSAIDLLVVYPHTHPPCGVHFVQVKSRGYLRPGERQDVIDLASTYGGEPILAWATASGPIHRRNLKEGVDIDDLENPGRTSSAARS